MKMIFILLLLLSTSVQAKTETCIASIYSNKYDGKQTASGIPLNDSALTAAHKSLPFHRKVKVTNIKNDKFVIVRITDRGPYIKRRCIDLSNAAAKEIECKGVCKVKVED